jgi:hypothetical protein
MKALNLTNDQRASFNLIFSFSMDKDFDNSTKKEKRGDHEKIINKVSKLMLKDEK